MGLSIAYTLRARATLSAAGVQRRLATWARDVRRQKLGRPTKITPVNPESSRFQMWLTRRLGGTDTIGVNVPPRLGFAFKVEIGAGCEPLVLGLCRYPGRVDLGGRVRHICGGWQLHGFCKTEYAALHGLDHFVDCHRRAIAILHAAPWGEINTSIEDEGEYWPERNETRLRANIGESQRGIAALAGALKDLNDAVGGPPIESPIFAHPQFERLEHEGRMARAVR